MRAEVVNLARSVLITGGAFSPPHASSPVMRTLRARLTASAHIRPSALYRWLAASTDDFQHEACGQGECACAGASRTKCTAGLHTIMHGQGTLKMSHTRVEKCGQRGIQGRYCAPQRPACDLVSSCRPLTSAPGT